MKKSKVDSKAQAAIEFLMTYGWVLIVLVVVIGAIAYFGLFDVSRFTSDKCEISNNFECVDYMIAENAIILQIKNNAGTDLYISRFNYSRNGVQLCYWPLNFHMNTGDVHTFTTFCNVGSASAKQSIRLDMGYYKSPISNHTAVGQITNSVEGTYAALSEEEICSRATIDGLCCLLDLYFGAGTKDRCHDPPPPQDYCDVSC